MFEMLYRDKRIGKSIYRIVKQANSYRIMELFAAPGAVSEKLSKEQWDRVDDALRELERIDREQYYTDPFFSSGFRF